MIECIINGIYLGYGCAKGNYDMIYLETERLILRDYHEEDFNEYYRLKADPKTMYYLQDIQLFTREDAYEDFHKVLADLSTADRKYYFLHTELKDSHEQVGSVSESITVCIF